MLKSMLGVISKEQKAILIRLTFRMPLCLKAAMDHLAEFEEA